MEGAFEIKLGKGGVKIIAKAVLPIIGEAEVEKSIGYDHPALRDMDLKLRAVIKEGDAIKLVVQERGRDALEGLKFVGVATSIQGVQHQVFERGSLYYVQRGSKLYPVGKRTYAKVMEWLRRKQLPASVNELRKLIGKELGYSDTTLYMAILVGVAKGELEQYEHEGRAVVNVRSPA